VPVGRRLVLLWLRTWSGLWSYAHADVDDYSDFDIHSDKHTNIHANVHSDAYVDAANRRYSRAGILA
jgi:hypothetical protein